MLALALIAALLGSCAAQTGGTGDLAAGAAGAVRLFAVNVGKGDALILRVGDCVCLIDTGKAWACGAVRGALRRMGVGEAGLDAVFITHTDDDHTGGLGWLSEGEGALPVKQWYASAMYTGVGKGGHPAEKAALARGQQVQWLKRGDVVALGDTGALLRVLAPSALAEDEDDNSLVMLLESAQGRMLLTGDMELPEEAELLSHGDDLRCAVIKVPNHGDGDATGEALARAAAAQIALISTDSAQKPGTPDPAVVARLQAAGGEVFVTENSGLGVLAELSGGVATAEAVWPDEPVAEGLYLAGVDADDDRVVIGNRSDGAVALDGFTLYSERGGELFLFPAGASVAAGGTLTVGTRSTGGECDLVWPDKKVIHRKKSDAIRLYDGWGRLLDRMDNGIE